MTAIDKESIRNGIENRFLMYDDVSLAYLYGSFLRDGVFNDIDIAVLVSKEMSPYDLFKYQMNIAGDIERSIIPRCTCDVRILNNAPVEFAFEVVKTGSIVFSQSESFRVEYEAEIISRYLDLRYLYDRVDSVFLTGVS